MPLPKVDPTDYKECEQSLAMCFANFKQARKQESTFRSLFQILSERQK